MVEDALRAQRASDENRDRAVELINDAVAMGRLTTEEGEQRVRRALSAKTIGELLDLTDDLPGEGLLTRTTIRSRAFRLGVLGLVGAALIVVFLLLFTKQATTTGPPPLPPTSTSTSTSAPAPLPHQIIGEFCRNAAAAVAANPLAPTYGTRPDTPPPSTDYPSLTPDVQTAISLDNAKDVVNTVQAGNITPFDDISLTCLGDFDSHFAWVSGSAASPGPTTISIALSKSYDVLAAKSTSGTCWFLLWTQDAGAVPTSWQIKVPGAYWSDSEVSSCSASAASAQNVWLESGTGTAPQLSA